MRKIDLKMLKSAILIELEAQGFILGTVKVHRKDKTIVAFISIPEFVNDQDGGYSGATQLKQIRYTEPSAQSEEERNGFWLEVDGKSVFVRGDPIVDKNVTSLLSAFIRATLQAEKEDKSTTSIGHDSRTDEPVAVLNIEVNDTVYCLKVFPQSVWIQRLDTTRRVHEEAFLKHGIERDIVNRIYDNTTKTWNINAITALIDRYEHL